MLNKIWSFIKSQASVLWHVIGGVVTGSILPSLAQSAIAGHMTTAGVVSTVVSGLVGAIVGYAQHSNNQLVAGAANQITPAVQSQIENFVTDKVTTAIANLGKKAGMVLVGLLLLAGVASAQPVEKSGWGINPEFSAPYMFGQDATGTFVSVPSFGVGADIGWKDYLVDGNDKAVKYSLGVVVSANLGQAQPVGPKSVLNGLIGGEAGYKGINFVVGNQVLGDPLTGPGGSRWLVYVGYDVSALFGGWTPF